MHIIGIGVGNLDFLTSQAIDAINDSDVFFIADKSFQCYTNKYLATLRKLIYENFFKSGNKSNIKSRLIKLADPPRSKVAGISDYCQIVSTWHNQRVQIWSKAIKSKLKCNNIGAFLVWGDPATYDSILRILKKVSNYIYLEYDVISGITSVQALTSQHKIPLNKISESVLITTGRQLCIHSFKYTTVVILDPVCSFQCLNPKFQIWWGAYLGMPDEILLSGKISEISGEIIATRAKSKIEYGWIMDTYLLGLI